MNTRLAKRNYNIQQWKTIIQDRNNTNLTVDEYCKQNGLSRNSYFYWLRIIREEVAAIYHTDNMYKGTSPKEILDNRQQSVRPLVDAYFAWVKEMSANPGPDQSSAIKAALNYSLNQEQYLKTFLTEPEVPLDNNDAERSIKKFCVCKHSWHIIESKNGAKASAMMYSIAETSKANGLNPFEYFQYLMDQLKEYPRNNVPEDKLAELMPWSETLPDYCKQPNR